MRSNWFSARHVHANAYRVRQRPWPRVAILRARTRMAPDLDRRAIPAGRCQSGMEWARDWTLAGRIDIRRGIIRLQRQNLADTGGVYPYRGPPNHRALPARRPRHFSLEY